MLRGVTFLGTSSGVPTKFRNVSATVLLHASGIQWLFDCGEGTQHQMQRSEFASMGRIDKIFLTHLHGDHCYGLPGLMCSMSMHWAKKTTGDTAGAEEEEDDHDAPPSFAPFSDTCPYLEIVGPLHTAQYIRTVLKCSEAFLPFQYRVIELIPNNCEPDSQNDLHLCEVAPLVVRPFDGTSFEVPLTGAACTVRASPLTHRVFSLGYVVQEPDQPGALDMKTAEALGVPKGPLLGQLKNGNAITLPNGTVVTPAQVVGPTQTGRKYVHLGDTSNSDHIVPLAAGADWLVHESTFDDSTRQLAEPRGHSTSRMAGGFARQVAAKMLLLTHFSARHLPRSKDPSVVDTLEAQAREECPDSLVVAVEDHTFIDFAKRRK